MTEEGQKIEKNMKMRLGSRRSNKKVKKYCLIAAHMDGFCLWRL